MNMLQTIEVGRAADGALEFAPKTLCLYHHKGTDLKEFEKQANAGATAIEMVKANEYG